MSDDPSTWWNLITEESVKLALEYMPRLPYGVLVSSVSVRALGELHGATEHETVTKRASSRCSNKLARFSSNEKYPYRMKKLLDNKDSAFTHAVHFVIDEAHPEHPVCMINVYDVKRVERMLWWLQMAQPRAIQLQHAEHWSADKLQHVLDLLFTDKPVLRSGVPLYTNLLKLRMSTGEAYHCTNLLETLRKCVSLKKLDVSGWENVCHLEGLEHFTLLEELDLSLTTVDSLEWLRHCTDLTRLNTIQLCACQKLETTRGIEGVRNLEHIDLHHSSVSALTGLAQCTSLRTINLNLCSALSDTSELEHLQFLQTVRVNGMSAVDLSLFCDAKRLTILDLGGTDVEDLTPLQHIRTLEELTLDYCERVTNLEPLRGMVGLKRLYVESTQVNDLEPLASCSALKVLSLANCSRVQSIAALARLTAMECLELTATPIENLAPLTHLVRMRSLYLRHCKDVQCLTPLANMVDLTLLTLECTAVSDLTPLTLCVQLKELSLTCCRHVKSLAPLAGMTLLEDLHVGGTGVKDLSPLAICKHLSYLCLKKTPVEDITPLQSCVKMEVVSLLDCHHLRDIRVLQHLPLLTRVWISMKMKNEILATGVPEHTLTFIPTY